MADNKQTDVEGGEQESESLTTRTMRIVIVVSLYFFISIALVFTNKYVLSKYDFPFPLILSEIQLVIALICIITLGWLGQSISMLSMFPPFEFNLEIARKTIPLTFVYIAMLAFNNVCLQYVHVTFYQVARSLTIFFSIIFTKILLGKNTSLIAIGACTVVVIGFITGSLGEVNFNYIGLITGVLSSMFVSLYGIYVKSALTAVDGNHWRLLIYNTILAILFLLPVVFVSGEITELEPVLNSINTDTLMMILLTGLFGFAINIALFMQIRYTSPLTNSISGTAKACVQTLLGVIFFRNEISNLNALGIFLVIAGSAWYSQIRYKEMQQADKALKTAK
eukprot:TRINITY_DN683_c0_g2_i2.p1 TRINITY_DN683_c0_g2~~TRINITY_DN683_c0_g2_i2.p1  ORF type:complete len:367 (-),score=48.57 TRINITY_DN683_c0_g2_i2:54-1064(-)